MLTFCGWEDDDTEEGGIDRCQVIMDRRVAGSRQILTDSPIFCSCYNGPCLHMLRYAPWAITQLWCWHICSQKSHIYASHTVVRVTMMISQDHTLLIVVCEPGCALEVTHLCSDSRATGFLLSIWAALEVELTTSCLQHWAFIIYLF